MSLNLIELKCLVDALGLDIPEAILNQRARAEEFATKQEQVISQGGAKPPEWSLRNEFEQLLAQARTASQQQQFDPAFKLLENAEQLLQQPDAPPSPPEPPPVPPAPPVEPAAKSEPQAPAAELQPVDGLLTTWLEAKERVDGQIARLQTTLRRLQDPACQRIAELGLNGVTGQLQVGLQVALTECERSGGRDPNLRAKATGVIQQYQQFLNTNKVIALCEENPFGVNCDIRGTLLPALAELEAALKN